MYTNSLGYQFSIKINVFFRVSYNAVRN